MWFDDHILAKADSTRHARPVFHRRDNPDIIAESAGDLFKDMDTNRINTVIITDQDTADSGLYTLRQ
jgi:hypothetical protein